MKTVVFLVLFSIISINPLFAQNTVNKTIDSLKTELTKAKEDNTKIKLLNKLSSYSDYINSNEVLKYEELALKLSKKSNNKRAIGNAYINLAVAYEMRSDYVRSLDYLYKALKIYEALNDKIGLSLTYNNLGLIYIDNKNYKQGLQSYNKALQLNLELKKERTTSLLLNNIGDVYLQQKEYQKALSYFYKSLALNRKLNDVKCIGLNLTNIGISYIDLKNYIKGIEAINESTKTYNNDFGLFNSFNKYELGRAYYLMSLDESNQKNKNDLLNKSIDYLKNALNSFQKFESLKDIQESNFYLSKANKNLGKDKIALDYFEKYTEIKDLIFSDDSKNKMANLESQREIDLRDKQIEIQHLKIKSEARKVYLLITITIAAAVLLGLFFWLYLSKIKTNQLLNKKNQLISEINNQKDKFFSIIAHDLRGPFNGFLGLTELLAEDLESMTPEEIQFAAGNMRNSAKNLFRLLENLLEWSKMEQGLIPFVPQEYLLLPIVSECIVTLQDAANIKEIKINTDISENTTVFADNNIIQAVIRNILSNAIKFTPKGGSISIQSEEDYKNTIISITDTGIGMNSKIIENLFTLDVQNNRKGTNDEPSTGLGLILCKDFVEKHGGKIWMESEEGKGSTFYFNFPKKNSDF